MEANNTAAMREAVGNALWCLRWMDENTDNQSIKDHLAKPIELLTSALAATPRKGKWMNGRNYEYEYAYCSECERMQWAGWDTHEQAKENIESFADNYRFCPGCGAEMEGGVYVQ